MSTKRSRHTPCAVGNSRHTACADYIEIAPPIPARLLSLARLVVLGLLLTLSGCREESIDTAYGRRSGIGAASVNGTAVLAEMFEQAGHKVTTRASLSPGLRKADCIVWFPDNFQPPSQKTRQWLEQWLFEEGGRTLIYVGRDFDAEARYWQSIQKLAPADQQPEIQRRMQSAAARFSLQRSQVKQDSDGGWFSLDPTVQPGALQSLSSSADWLDGIDPSKTEIELNSRLILPNSVEPLLQSGTNVVVGRRQVGASQIIFVANGSFLLNLPLVNHEHRSLASRLIDEIGDPRQEIAFLQSRGDPPIRNKDPNPGPPSGLEVLDVWPTNWILLHLIVVGILFCFARYPIFGRPRVPKADSTSDFGKHIEALGRWLARSRDRGYAAERLASYRQIREEGGKGVTEAASQRQRITS